jgi:hypothetical protein
MWICELWCYIKQMVSKRTRVPSGSNISYTDKGAVVPRWGYLPARSWGTPSHLLSALHGQGSWGASVSLLASPQLRLTQPPTECVTRTRDLWCLGEVTCQPPTQCVTRTRELGCLGELTCQPTAVRHTQPPTQCVRWPLSSVSLLFPSVGYVKLLVNNALDDGMTDRLIDRLIQCKRCGTWQS